MVILLTYFNSKQVAAANEIQYMCMLYSYVTAIVEICEHVYCALNISKADVHLKLVTHYYLIAEVAVNMSEFY